MEWKPQLLSEDPGPDYKDPGTPEETMNPSSKRKEGNDRPIVRWPPAHRLVATKHTWIINHLGSGSSWKEGLHNVYPWLYTSYWGSYIHPLATLSENHWATLAAAYLQATNSSRSEVYLRSPASARNITIQPVFWRSNVLCSDVCRQRKETAEIFGTKK